MPILDKLREFLESNKVAYSIHSHPTAFTAQEIAALAHVKGRALVKVVIVKAGGGFVMLALPADHKVEFGRLKGILGAGDVRLAQESEFRDLFPGCELGAMPPFGDLFGLPVYVDRSLEKDAEIVFNAGTHTQTVKMALADFVRLAKPRMEQFAVHV